MKLKLLRQSGDPVTLESRDAFKADFQAFYDRAKERAGLDMLKMHRFLAWGDRLLAKKHSVDVEVEMPKTHKAWEKLCVQFDGPIMIAQRQDNKKIIGIIMDVMG